MEVRTGPKCKESTIHKRGMNKWVSLGLLLAGVVAVVLLLIEYSFPSTNADWVIWISLIILGSIATLAVVMMLLGRGKKVLICDD